jgi:hypothetical protein
MTIITPAFQNHPDKGTVAALIGNLWAEMASHDLINLEIPQRLIDNLTCSCPDDDFCGNNWHEILLKVLSDIASMTAPNEEQTEHFSAPGSSQGICSSPDQCPQQQLYTYLFTKIALEHLRENNPI